MKTTIFFNYVWRNGQIDGLATYRMWKAEKASALRLAAIQTRVTKQIREKMDGGKG